MRKVLLGDCIDLVNIIEDKSIDMILTDPPYGISNEVIISRSRSCMKYKGNTNIVYDFGEWDKFEYRDSCLQFTYKWVDAVESKLREGGIFVVFYDRDKINYISHYLQDKYGYKNKGYFAYIKSNPVPQARKVKWMNAWECAVLLQKPNGKLTYNYQLGQQADYIILPICGGKERTEHPTQKPEKLFELFVKYWTNEGDTVLDPFAGSGTTAVVCEKLNRNYICIEKDDNYYKIMEKRLANYKEQIIMFK